MPSSVEQLTNLEMFRSGSVWFKAVQKLFEVAWGGLK